MNERERGYSSGGYGQDGSEMHIAEIPMVITARSGTLETLADMARSAVSAEEIRLETMVPMDREDSRAAVSQKKISICVLLQTIYAAVITERLLMYWTGLKTGARFGIFTAHPLIPDWAITLRLLNRRKRPVRLEPDNTQYQMLYQQLQNGGTWYQLRQSSYGYPGTFDTSCCAKLCIANLLCNLCCGGSGLCCGGYGGGYYI